MSSPGPGKYSPTMKNKKRYKRVKFGYESRDTSFMRDTPGPGSYDPELMKYRRPRRQK